MILCAGAIGSPQLLLRSGVGPAGELRALGLEVAEDLPGVGRNLQDHPMVTACYAAEPRPGSRVRTAAALRDYIRRTLTSYYHLVGSCALGTGPVAVVDPELRVHGVARLRVADASVFPVIPNANTHATVLAVAERAAELVAAPC